jgi:hypothetical protein
VYSSEFFVYRTLNKNKQVKYKTFLHEVEGRYQKSRIEVSHVLMTLPEEQSTPRGAHQADSLGISEYTNLKKLLLLGKEKKKYPAIQCKLYAAHKN